METTLSIGRDASNNIVLNDKMVSRKHAQLLVSADGRVLIKDLGSSNGTFVNGNKISEQLLNAGDIVKCGTTFLNWSLAIKENGNSSYSSNQKQESPQHKNQFSFSSRPIDVDDIRHEKEKTYFIIKMVFSCLIWILLFSVIIIAISNINYIPTFGLISLIVPISFYVLIILFISWIISLSFKARIYGYSVKVNINQYPEIHHIATEFSQRLRLIETPDIFICNRNGIVNAIAKRVFSKKYVLLNSSLVDLMLATKNSKALSMIIGHELGHHAAGHTSFWKNLFLAPASIIPFLGAAYSRACEFTADRIGFVLSDNLIESQNALIALALGSERLTPTVNVSEFCAQENEVPEFIGFIQKIFSFYPRTTKRVLEITSFGNKNRIV
jgi:Zn-dependent protease with chaperone function